MEALLPNFKVLAAGATPPAVPVEVGVTHPTFVLFLLSLLLIFTGTYFLLGRSRLH